MELQHRTLGEALPAEMARVRDRVLPVFEQCGPSGAPCVLLIRRDLDLAAKAMVEGDLAAMIVIYKELQGWKA